MFLSDLENTTFYPIDENKIGNEKFFSTGHGLQADFIKHFNNVIGNVEIKSFDRLNKVYNETTILNRKILTYSMISSKVCQ